MPYVMSRIFMSHIRPHHSIILWSNRDFLCNSLNQTHLQRYIIFIVESSLLFKIIDEYYTLSIVKEGRHNLPPFRSLHYVDWSGILHPLSHIGGTRSVSIFLINKCECKMLSGLPFDIFKVSVIQCSTFRYSNMILCGFSKFFGRNIQLWRPERIVVTIRFDLVQF